MSTNHVAVRSIAHSPAPDTYLDSLAVHSAGLVRVSGWSLKPTHEVSNLVTLEVGTRPIASSHVFRTFRQDVRRITGGPADYWGIVVEFILPVESIDSITLRTPTATFTFHSSDLGVQFFDAPYRTLWQQDSVLHREQIYGSGPPTDDSPVDVLSAVTALTGSILDFGCGNGALVRRLRARGVDAQGLEMDRPEIRDSLRSDVQPYVRLYDGQLPTPYPDKSFDCVVAVEVIEHLPDLVPAIAKLARLARREVLLTTPDISAVPLLSAENVVPWHLLEATHFNFFTQTSLERLLSDYLGEVEFGRVSPNTINGTQYWTSLLVWCREPRGLM